MIDADVRNAIYQLHLAGTPLHDISRQFRVSRNSVRRIIRQQGAMPQTVRKDKIQIDAELLRRLYGECEGWVQRIHEKLLEEEKIQVSYPTLTRLVRELGLGRPSSARCDHVPDDVAGCSEFERVLLNDLAIAGKYLRRVMTKCQDARLKSRAFHAQGHLLSGGLLTCLDSFRERMKEFYDRCGRA